ncbi:MAG TPA: AAA family ATPase [Sedimentisphaerales bacterium]|nr:AAA family ATPase [Sedimentisphaerales bacterium]
MNLKWVHIENYRSCKDIPLEFGSMHALVGANNSGKSNILRALDFLFNPSTTNVDKESFWNGDTSRIIRVEALFDNLTGQEKEELKGYLCPEGTFHIARTCKVKDSLSSEEEYEISQHYCKPMPKFEWLCEDKIKGDKIAEWWRNQVDLTANGNSFVDFVGGTKPNVGTWKQKANEFTDQYLTEDDFEDQWADNPKGYAGVLKGELPHFIFIPAVRDISEEAKVTKSNPFGRLLYEVLSNITDAQRADLDGFLSNVKEKLNRTGGDDRLDSIVKTETKLNEYLSEYMTADLEIEFQTPTLQLLLTTPRLFVNDGFRNIVENKGHGLQRAIIFSILRCYSELIAGQGADRKRGTIFAIEEPELYMHPQAQRTIRHVFRKIVDNNNMDQIFFATHSSLLLDVAYFDEIVRVEAIQGDDGNGKTIESKAWQLPIQKLIDDLKIRYPDTTPSDESIRERYANAYHPMRSEGFFAKRIILVEGATEQYALPIYAEALLKHPLYHLGISVVDCGGKGPMDRLYRIFNELGIPCYLLFDYDKNSKDGNTLSKSKELLEMAGEATDAPSGILIKDRVSCFPEKWEIDLANEIEKIEQFTADARSELGLNEDSGKPLVARYIARQLTLTDPPFIPPSIKSIIEKTINIKWEKSNLVLSESSD